MAKAQLSLHVAPKGEDGAAVRLLEERFNRFENKNTFWRHQQLGRMDEFDRAYEAGLAKVRLLLGRTYPLVVGGRDIDPGAHFTVRSPADTDVVVGHFASGTKDHAKKAVAASRAGFTAWSGRPWQERAAILERAADLFAEHFYELCAVMTLEAGKTRYEASIDVDEAVDFLRFYAAMVREMDGYNMRMGSPVPTERCSSHRRPWGVFAVVCPFNFPIAITTGMTAAALVMGNTVVLKPSGKGCLSGWWVFDLLRKAGVPSDAMQFLTAGDHGISQELLTSHDVDGLVFTGSKKVGFQAMKAAAEGPKPKPIIAELGGKNAIVVSDQADLDKAVQGVFRSAFGFQGQKCSACSRVYVHEKVADEFLARLVKLTEAAQVGLPWLKESYMGPVIEGAKFDLLADLVAQVKRAAARSSRAAPAPRPTPRARN